MARHEINPNVEKITIRSSFADLTSLTFIEESGLNVAMHARGKTTKRIAILAISLCAASPAFSQGEFIFNNVSPSTGPASANIGSDGASGEGAVGAFLGSDYTASLFYLPGAGYTQTAFDSLNPNLFAGADTQFFGTTGFARGSINNAFVGAGFFDGGVVVLPLPNLETITVEIRAWYNVSAVNYADALAKGFNVGESKPVQVELTVRPIGPEHLDSLTDFVVGSVPEPSSFLLAMLGATILLTWNRRKYETGVRRQR
jgi:hypothetical protein